MKRIGLIDNLQNLHTFLDIDYEQAKASEIMAATGGNTGNVAFVYAIKKIIANPVIRIDWGWEPEAVRKQVDHLIVCCANQLGSHVDLGGWADRLIQFGLPVTLIGLGAQAKDTNTFPEIPEGSERFLDCIQYLCYENACNVAVRGSFTYHFLKQKGIDSKPLGCPSLHISNQSNLGRRILHYQVNHPIKKIAVAAGNPWHTPSASLEPILVDVVEQFQGDYILQHPESMLQIAMQEKDTIPEATLKHFLNVYKGRFNAESMFSWYRHYASIFIDTPNWMRFLAKFDMALGPRYHGIALAIQTGKPGCVITIDSRTEELCEGSGVKHIALNEALSMNAKTLVEAAHWTENDVERFEFARRKQSIAYVEFLKNNGLEPSKHLLFLSYVLAKVQ